jgi:hypothetical protein
MVRACGSATGRACPPAFQVFLGDRTDPTPDMDAAQGTADVLCTPKANPAFAGWLATRLTGIRQGCSVVFTRRSKRGKLEESPTPHKRQPSVKMDGGMMVVGYCSLVLNDMAAPGALHAGSSSLSGQPGRNAGPERANNSFRRYRRRADTREPCTGRAWVAEGGGRWARARTNDRGKRPTELPPLPPPPSTPPPHSNPIIFAPLHASPGLRALPHRLLILPLPCLLSRTLLPVPSPSATMMSSSTNPRLTAAAPLAQP